MTEFETATIAFQQAQLALQQAQLALQRWQMWAAVAIPVVGIVQALIVWSGIRLMVQNNKDRTAADTRRAEAAEKATDRRAEAAEKAADRRAEAAEKAADRRAEAAEKAADRRAEAESARHAEAMRALEVLIERTGRGTA